MGIQGALGGQGLNIMSLNKKKYSSENSIDRHSKGPDAHQSFCSAMSNYILHNSQAGSDHFTAALCFIGPQEGRGIFKVRLLDSKLGIRS